MDLATLMQQAALLNQSQGKMAQDVSGLQASASNAVMESAENMELAASNTREAELTRLQGELNTQNARVKVANAFGTNVNAVSDVITGMASQMRETALQLSQAQAEVTRIESNSDLFGNPLGWLEDLVSGDGARAKRDALASSFDVQAKLANNLNAATQTSVQTQNAISETLTQTSIAQLAQVKSAEVQHQAAVAKAEAARLGAASIETLMQQGSIEFSRNLGMYNAAQAAESMALARQERADRLKDKQELDKSWDEITENVNTYNRNYGLPEVPVAAVKRYWGTAGELGEQLRNADVSGMRIRGGVTEGTLGTTPADTYATITQRNIQLPPAWSAGRRVLTVAEDRFNQMLDVVNPQTGKTLRQTAKPEELKHVYNQQVQAVAAELQGKIEHGTGNPFQVPAIPTVLESPAPDAKQLAASQFRKSVLDSLVATGVSDPTPELLMATSLSAVEKGEITFAEAVDGGVSFFRAGHALKAATSGFTTLNIPVAAAYPVPTDFLTTTDRFAVTPVPAGPLGTGLFGTGLDIGRIYTPEQKELRQNRVKTLNLTNAQDYTTALTILMSQRRSKALREALKGSGSK